MRRREEMKKATSKKGGARRRWLREVGACESECGATYTRPQVWGGRGVTPPDSVFRGGKKAPATRQTAGVSACAPVPCHPAAPGVGSSA